jgi:hypothetical protein
VARFISYPLIQRLVLSSPSPVYVGRVASAFQSSQGNLQTVITSLLTDPEAQSEGTGKLAEPILYATGLLRALNATVTAADALTNQATLMGQIPLTPGSVFSYFSPFYSINVPGVAQPAVAPEFQALNDALDIYEDRASVGVARIASNALATVDSVLRPSRHQQAQGFRKPDREFVRTLREYLEVLYGVDELKLAPVRSQKPHRHLGVVEGDHDVGRRLHSGAGADLPVPDEEASALRVIPELDLGRQVLLLQAPREGWVPSGGNLHGFVQG